ncbi:MAG: helix-turn-helix domain-containing protein [Campylobacterota bacterium]|nr:helix-turn-helix domain-containing protein [Campylobacterota bacterium]
MEIDEIYYTVEELAKKLKVLPNTVHKWIQNGKLDYYKFVGNIRISQIQLEAFMQESVRKKSNGGEK